MKQKVAIFLRNIDVLSCFCCVNTEGHNGGGKSMAAYVGNQGGEDDYELLHKGPT